MSLGRVIAESILSEMGDSHKISGFGVRVRHKVKMMDSQDWNSTFQSNLWNRVSCFRVGPVAIWEAWWYVWRNLKLKRALLTWPGGFWGNVYEVGCKRSAPFRYMVSKNFEAWKNVINRKWKNLFVIADCDARTISNGQSEAFRFQKRSRIWIVK